MGLHRRRSNAGPRSLRHTKVILIDESAAGHWCPPLDVLQAARSVVKKARLLLKWIKRYGTVPPDQDSPPKELPSQEPERTAEVVRRLLPELRILDRYERRAISRRNNALRKIRSNLSKSILAKGTQF